MRQNQDVQMAPDKKRNFWKVLLLKDDFFNLVMMTRASMLSQQDNNVTMLQLQKKFVWKLWLKCVGVSKARVRGSRVIGKRSEGKGVKGQRKSPKQVKIGFFRNYLFFSSLMDACVSPRYTQFCHMPYWTTNVIFGSRPDSQVGSVAWHPKDGCEGDHDPDGETAWFTLKYYY